MDVFHDHYYSCVTLSVRAVEKKKRVVDGRRGLMLRRTEAGGVDTCLMEVT